MNRGIWQNSSLSLNKCHFKFLDFQRMLICSGLWQDGAKWNVDNVEITVCFRHFPVEQVNRTSLGFWNGCPRCNLFSDFVIKKLISVFMCEWFELLHKSYEKIMIVLSFVLGFSDNKLCPENLCTTSLFVLTFWQPDSDQQSSLHNVGLQVTHDQYIFLKRTTRSV